MSQSSMESNTSMRAQAVEGRRGDADVAPTRPSGAVRVKMPGWIAQRLERADIILDGPRPWDPRIQNARVMARVLRSGSLGLGESYMDGDWDCADLDGFFERILRHGLDRPFEGRGFGWLGRAAWRFLNLQSPARARIVGERHYDVGNDLYTRMLDPTMSYSCGYWAQADTLEAAQRAKLALIAQKLHLEPGMRVLDIGCGWGGLLEFLAREYGVEGVGVTISREQARLARERVAGLPVDIRLLDYRELDEPFDRIVSVGMFEHVGPKNYAKYFAVARRCLVDGGLFLLHTIGTSRRHALPDPWIHRYIFPNGYLPTLREIDAAVEGRFVVEDVHNFGADYDPTLIAWRERFDAAWPDLRTRYDERFRRMWRYYLSACAAAFRVRHLQVWQWVLSPNGVSGGYRRPA